jgi:hypothetical protein
MRLTTRVAVLVAAALALVLAGAEGAAAQDSGTAASRPAAVSTTAQVEDQFGEQMRIEEPSFYRPAAGLSLGGGGKGTKLKELRVWKGAHEIMVPLEKITRIDVIGPADQDLLQVRLTLAGGLKVEGKVERDLELRGRVDYGQYQIKFERVKSVTIRA